MDFDNFQDMALFEENLVKAQFMFTVCANKQLRRLMGNKPTFARVAVMITVAHIKI